MLGGWLPGESELVVPSSDSSGGILEKGSGEHPGDRELIDV